MSTSARSRSDGSCTVCQCVEIMPSGAPLRETSGVGDFVGGGGPLKPPAPMNPIEVKKMLGTATHGEGKPKQVVKLDFEKGDRVRVKDGAFSGSEAEVKAITMPKDPTDTPKVTVVVTIWGRPVEMEMDYWHVEKL